MVTMNLQPEIAGVRRDTYVQALRAESISIGPYVPAPITTWRRLQWQDCDGPKVMWTETLRQGGIDYSTASIPNCESKVGSSLEMGWNYVDIDEAKMAQIASALENVEGNLDALGEWEEAQGWILCTSCGSASDLENRRLSTPHFEYVVDVG